MRCADAMTTVVLIIAIIIVVAIDIVTTRTRANAYTYTRVTVTIPLIVRCAHRRPARRRSASRSNRAAAEQCLHAALRRQEGLDITEQWLSEGCSEATADATARGLG